MTEKRYPLWIYVDPDVARVIKKTALKAETTIKSVVEEAILYWYRMLKEGELYEIESDKNIKDIKAEVKREVMAEIKEARRLRVRVLSRRKLIERKRKEIMKREERRAKS